MPHFGVPDSRFGFSIRPGPVYADLTPDPSQDWTMRYPVKENERHLGASNRERGESPTRRRSRSRADSSEVHQRACRAGHAGGECSKCKGVIPSRTTKPAFLPTRSRSRTSSPIGRSENRHAAAASERNLPTTLVILP